MSPDYSNIPAAIRDETLNSLRESAQNARSNAASHRKQAEAHQSLADRETHFADRDDERARQWQAQLDLACEAIPLGEGTEADDETDPTPADVLARLRGIFGEPVEGRDFHAMPGRNVEHFDQAEADDVRAIRREMAEEAGDFDGEDEHNAPGEDYADHDAHDPATCRDCLDACTSCGSLNHHANDCEAEL